jgi:hypothetical protein
MEISGLYPAYEIKVIHPIFVAQMHLKFLH